MKKVTNHMREGVKNNENDISNMRNDTNNVKKCTNNMRQGIKNKKEDTNNICKT